MDFEKYIDEIVSKIYLMERLHYEKSPTRPRIVIYMRSYFFRELVGSIDGRVSASAYSMYDSNEILGYPVFEVIGDKHPNYKIYIDSEVL